MSRKKQKFMLLSSIITIVFGAMLSLIKLPKWCLLGCFRMTKAETIGCYIAVFVTGMLLHMLFYRGRNRWIHVLMISGLPVFFYFGFCQELRGAIYVVCGMIVFFSFT